MRRGEPGEREQWLLVHKRDKHAVEGWEPLDHPRSVLTGRTNDDVRAARDRLWLSDRPAADAGVRLTATPEEMADQLAELDDMRGDGTSHLFGRELKVTNLDKVLFPGRDGEPPMTKRELLRYAAAIAPTVLPHLQGRALNLRRHPDGCGDQGVLAQAAPRPRAGVGRRLGQP